ncbi:MAG: DUF348 domain-containing protein [Anaerolineales bacterium]|nr:DUF348 domain-containing protein [Anaerolineales bacterium]
MWKSLFNRIQDTKKKATPWLSVSLIIIGLAALFFSLHKEITLSLNGKQETSTTFALTVKGFLRQQDIPIREDDAVNPPLNHILWGNEKISIRRASEITVIHDQGPTQITTTERTPANILAQMEILLYPKDRVIVDGQSVDPDSTLPYHPYYTLQVVRATPVTVYSDKGVKEFTTNALTLAEALWDADILLHEGDALSLSPQTALTGEPIQVQLTRAKPLRIILPEKTLLSRTTAETVGPALMEAGLTLQGRDYSIPEETEPIPENREIKIVRVEEKVILEQEPIDFSSKFQPVADLNIDQRTIVEGGKYGLQASRVRVVYENGEEVSRVKEKEWTAKDPQPRIVGYGTKLLNGNVNTPEGEKRYWRKITAYATSYHSGQPGLKKKTATGYVVQQGIIAVSLEWVPYMRGLKVYIPGYGLAQIEDAGTGIPGRYWVDLAYKEENYVPWSQWVDVYFLYPSPPPEDILYVLY